MPKDMALASRQADAPAWAALRIRVALDRLATDARECGLDFTAHMIEAAAEAAAESGASLATAYRIDDDAPIVTFSRLPFRWYLKRLVFEPDGITSSTKPPPSVRS